MRSCGFYKHVILFILILNIGLLSSCYEKKETEKNNYTEFRDEMKNKNSNIYEFLPALDSEDSIDDMYLYYSDKDFLDSFYVVYLNCLYLKERYLLEYQRVLKLSDENDVVVNSEYFNCESILMDAQIDTQLSSITYLRYKYVLFNEDENRVVYVMAFEKGENLQTANIPMEYVPKEDRELIRKTGDRKTGDGSLY